MSTIKSKKRKELELNSFKIKNKNYNLNSEVPKVGFRITSNLYPRRVTRGLKKMLNEVKDFIIVESYRCMPLLGDEEKNAPDWTVHYVRYDIVFIENSEGTVPLGPEKDL